MSQQGMGNGDAPPLLVLPGGKDSERDVVVQAWQGRGWEVCRLERFWAPPAMRRERVRLYGGETFCLVLAQRLGLELVSPPDDLLVTLDWKWLQRQVECAPLREAVRRVFPLFAKPLAPKIFRSAVYEDAPDLAQETRGLDGSTPVLVSEPVRLLAEARCLVLNQQVVSAALYEGEGSLDEARAFAQGFLRHHALPETLALDVGYIAGRGWAVLEANAIWGAGLNGCDPDRMVDCLLVATKLGDDPGSLPDGSPPAPVSAEEPPAHEPQRVREIYIDFDPYEDYPESLPAPGAETAELPFETTEYDDAGEWGLFEMPGGYGRLTFQGLDAIRAFRGRRLPWAIDPGHLAGSAFVVDNSQWLRERHAFLDEHYHGFYPGDGAADDLLGDFEHFVFIWKEATVEAIARGVWCETSDEPLAPGVLSPGHPFLSLPEDAIIERFDLGGVICQIRANPKRMDVLVEDAALCPQALFEFRMESGGTITPVVCRVEVRERGGTVQTFWRDCHLHGRVHDRREGVPSPVEAKAWVMPWLEEEGARRHRKLP